MATAYQRLTAAACTDRVRTKPRDREVFVFTKVRSIAAPETSGGQPRAPRGSDRPAFKARACRLAAGLVCAAMIVAAVAVPKANAAGFYASGGVIGPSQVRQARCTYQDYFRTLRLSTAAPAVYAPNQRAGGGNDWSWVRWRSFLVDRNGNTIARNNYSEFEAAWDNAPASFASGQAFDRVPAGSRIDIRIEWWNSTRQIGWVAYRVMSYVKYNGQVGPLGQLDSCA
jgi:hypothetical protein